jgi:hypothetical protein
MNERQRFNATMHYKPRDRAPICDFSFWDETLELWYEQGLPRSVNRFNSDDYFGMDGLMCYVLSKESSALTVPADPRRTVIDGVCVGLVPEFEPVVLEDLGDAEVIQQIDGVRVVKKKFMSSIPTHLEIGTWGADPVRYREEYGKDLLMIGGFDKRILAAEKAKIEAEVRRLAPLVDQGGYIGLCDHRVPPDVPLEHYLHYIKCVREIWGHGVNLKPMGTILEENG